LASEWSDVDPALVRTEPEFADAEPGATGSSHAALIEGELMTPSQRRNALLQLAQDMELHYLASTSE
jgi:hypothetical protein